MPFINLSQGSGKRGRAAALLLTAALGLAGAGRLRAVPQVLDSYHEVRFEETLPDGSTHAIAEEARHFGEAAGRTSVHAPPGTLFGGGLATVETGPERPGYVQWTAVRLANGAVPDTVAEMHARGAIITQDDVVFPDTGALHHGIWAGVRGRLREPMEGSFVSLRLAGQLDVADHEFNSYIYNFTPVHIYSDFTEGPASFVDAGSFSSFRFLNPERTEFEAFGLSMLPAHEFGGIVGSIVDLRLDVLAGPGAEIELIAPPAGVRIPPFGGGGGAPVIPEPSTLSLLALGALGALRSRRRSGI